MCQLEQCNLQIHAKVIGFITLFAGMLLGWAILTSLKRLEAHNCKHIIGIIVAVIVILVMLVSTILLLITTFQNERPSFLLPWIIFQIISTIIFISTFICGAAGAACVCVTINSGSGTVGMVGIIGALIMYTPFILIGSGIILGFNIYSLVMVFRYYRTL